MSAIKKVFIIGAVTGVEDEVMDTYNSTESIVSQAFPEAEITTPNTIMDFRNDFVAKHKDATEQEINREMVAFDLFKVQTADLLVADVSIVSTGVGIELGSVFQKQKNVLLFARQGCVVSNMVLGAFADCPLHRYETFEDFKNQLETELSKLQ